MGESAEPGPAGLLRPAPPGNARWSFDLRRVLSRVDRVAPGRFALATILGYVALSLVAYLPAWPGDPGRLVGYQCVCGDPVQQSWFLGWMPWALLHGHNPLFTNWIDYPIGANLGVNTEMPLLGLLAAPITFAAGSVASFSFLIWLAFPSSATAAFFVLRRWTRSNVASVCGGLLYGFSPYIVGQGFQHLNLSFVPLPPLIFMALYEVVVDQRSRPRRWGAALGLLVTAQYLISPEVLATTLVVAFLALVIVLVTRRRAIDRRRLVHIRRALVPGALISVVLLGYPIYYFFAGPRRFHGPVQGKGINNPFRVDLLGAIVPTSAQRFAPSALVSLGDKFSGGFGENGSYLGIALLLLVLWLVVRYRHDRGIVLAGALAVVAYVLALGPKLMIAHHLTAIPLPFDALGRLPLLEDVLPSRFSVYEQFFIAVIVALGLAHGSGEGALPAASASSPGMQARPRRRHSRPGTVAQLSVVVVGLVAVASLVPNWPTPTTPVSTALPAFFTSSLSNEIPAGSIVLTYPFDVSPENQPMLWQETDDFRWKLVGGYALAPKPSGRATFRPPALPPPRCRCFSPGRPWAGAVSTGRNRQRSTDGSSPSCASTSAATVSTRSSSTGSEWPPPRCFSCSSEPSASRGPKVVSTSGSTRRGSRAHRSGQRCTDCRTPATGTPGPRSTPEKLCQTKLRGISSEDSSEKPAQSRDRGDYVTDAVSEDRSRQIQLELVDDAMRDRRTGECSPTTRQRSRGAGTR